MLMIVFALHGRAEVIILNGIGMPEWMMVRIGFTTANPPRRAKARAAREQKQIGFFMRERERERESIQIFGTAKYLSHFIII